MDTESSASAQMRSLAPEALKELLSMTDQFIERVVHKTDGQESDAEHVSHCLGLMSKVLESYKAVELLCEHGYGNCGLILTRVMFEDAIEMKYIADNPMVRLEEVKKNELGSLRLTMRRLRRVEGSTPYEVDRILSRKQQNYLENCVSTSSIRNTFEQALACRLEGLFFEAYVFACMYIHTTSYAVQDYIREGKDEVVVGSVHQHRDQAMLIASFSVVLSLETGLSLFGMSDERLSETRGMLQYLLPFLASLLDDKAPTMSI